MFDRLGIIIGFSIVAVASLGLFVSRALPERYDAALARVVACTDAKNATTCSRPAVQKLLNLESAAKIMDDVAVRLTPQQCHYVGHVVGQQLFKRNRDVENSISRCSRACNSSCVHGIIGQAFAEELGLESADNSENLDFQHLASDEIQGVGQRLCMSTATCHGVGHVLFQVYGKFEPGLAMCKEIAAGQKNRVDCYHGVFMEYADILSSREIRQTPGVEYPTSESLSSLCSRWPTLEEKISCFPYFPRMVIPTLQKGGSSLAEATSRLREICKSYPRRDDRAACIFGIGVSSWYSSLALESHNTTGVCQEFSELLDQTACNLGQVSAFTREREPRVVSYCAALPDDGLRASCFQAVFYYLNRLDIPAQEAAELCKDDSVCIRESKNYKVVPLEQILKGFDS